MPTTTGPSLDVIAVVGVKMRVDVEAAMFLKGQGVARTLAQRTESPLASLATVSDQGSVPESGTEACRR